jgi:hypothetical protein
MALMTEARPTAEMLNTHLEDGGRVQVSTYARSVIYSARNAGMFKEGRDGNLYVQRGRSFDCLSFGGSNLMVAIRMS